MTPCTYNAAPVAYMRLHGPDAIESPLLYLMTTDGEPFAVLDEAGSVFESNPSKLDGLVYLGAFHVSYHEWERRTRLRDAFIHGTTFTDVVNAVSQYLLR